MNEKTLKALRIAGLVLHVLIAGLIVAAGSGKVFGSMPEEAISKMASIGIDDKIKLIGFGEITAAALMLIPQTRSLGVLAVSGFWGGVIVAHMGLRDSYALPVAMLALTWIGAYLRGIVKLPG